MNPSYIFRGNAYPKIYNKFSTVKLSKCICLGNTYESINEDINFINIKLRKIKILKTLLALNFLRI